LNPGSPRAGVCNRCFKLNYDEPLSNVAFKFKWRRYSAVSAAVEEFSAAVPKLTPADVQAGFSRLSPTDQIAMLSSADTAACLTVLENTPDQRGAALMAAVVRRCRFTLSNTR